MPDPQPATVASNRKGRPWPPFLWGVFLVLLGPVLYAVQLYYKQLWMPWYLPILSTMGVLLMATSVWRQPGFLRAAGLALFLLVCGFEWFMSLVTFKTPLYEGPANIGSPIPAFAATLGDGSSFTSDELASGKNSVLLFFRGRW